MKHPTLFGLALISQVIAFACFFISWDIATVAGPEKTILLQVLVAVVYVMNPFMGLTVFLDQTLRVPDVFYYLSFLFSFLLWLLLGYLIARRMEGAQVEKREKK